MKWEKIKQFFRPTKRKIILWIILFLIFPRKFGTYVSGEVFTSSTNSQWFFFGGVLYFLEFLWILLNLLTGKVSYLDNAFTLISPIIIMLVISYFLSCLIIFVYEKIRKKDKKR